MNAKNKFSKILEIERDVHFNKKVSRVIKKHFDFGHSVSLSYPDHLNAYAYQKSEPSYDIGTPAENSNRDANEYASTDYFVESFSNEIPVSTESTPGPGNIPVTRKEELPVSGKYTVEGTVNNTTTKEEGVNYGINDLQDKHEPLTLKPGEYATESSFEEDLKLILSGQKKYNEEEKRLVSSTAQSVTDDHDVDGGSSKPSDNHNNGLRSQDIANPHAIFDSLAKSFGNATSYDLGTFDLDKSFSDIEAAIAKKEESEDYKKKLNYKDNPGSVVIEKTSDNTTIISSDGPVKTGEGIIANPVIVSDEVTRQLSLNALDISEDFAIINENVQNPAAVNPAGLLNQHLQDHVCETGHYNQSLSFANSDANLVATPELLPLLSYLNINYDTFQPIENIYFSRLKELLVFHNIIGKNETLNSSNYAIKVKDFQRTIMNQANPDGIPGEETLFELQKNWAGKRGLSLVRSGIRNDAYGGSQIPFVLRSDALVKYDQLYNQVHQLGGMITSAGALRDLSDAVTAGRSGKSMHYTGLAFDLHTGSGLQNVAKDPYLVERSESNRWHIWNKVEPPNGNKQTIQAQVYNAATKTLAPVSVNESVINFKKLANDNGFKDIGNRPCFPQNYLCAEWWHFQCEAVLVPYISQFGSELLTIYTENQLSGHPDIWQNRKKIFKKEWF